MNEAFTLESFHRDFIQSIYSEAESRNLMRSIVFFEKVCEALQSTGDLGGDYEVAEYQKRGIEINGYDYDSERNCLYLLVNQFFQEENIHTLTQSDIRTKFSRLETFLQKSIEGLYIHLEEAYESYDMAFRIYDWFEDNKIDKIILLLITDGKATKNLRELEAKSINGIPINYRVIDIEYLYKIYLSENETSGFNVDVSLPFLQIKSNTKSYESYLTFLTGEQIVEIYEQYGKRLFEQNVRTFLQFRGNVNKGLRNTIETQPEMFFAYNNGLTATATNVVIDNDKIVKIENLQIVNGAQTTSSIYAAHKTLKKGNGLRLFDVSVQMKLSVVIDQDFQNEFVSKVSQYANTQNKVSKSDFFSNSPFHQEFKKRSQRIYAPAIDGAQKRTHWFYERVRGEYLNEQAYKKASEKTQFLIENPKNQSFEKTFLSKSENSWLMKPHIVAKGAQYSFAEFARYTTEKLESNSNYVTDEYFKEAITRVILFKTTEKLISNSSWYSGGYRAQTVTYTIAYLAYYIEKKLKQYLDYEKIWEKQKLPVSIMRAINKISETVYQSITMPPLGSANVAQWCKKEECWEKVKLLDIDLEFDNGLLIDKVEKDTRKKYEKKDQKLLKGIEIQIFVTSTPLSTWQQVYHYFEREKFEGVTQTDIEILSKFVQGRLTLPTEKQSLHLYNLYNKVLSEGYEL